MKAYPIFLFLFLAAAGHAMAQSPGRFTATGNMTVARAGRPFADIRTNLWTLGGEIIRDLNETPSLETARGTVTLGSTGDGGRPAHRTPYLYNQNQR
jgi:hypothetical protein